MKSNKSLLVYTYACRYAAARAPPQVDEMQDIVDATAEEIIRDGNTFTVVTFTTPLVRSNLGDFSLDQRLFILYAWGMELNGNASDPMSINLHGNTLGNRGFSASPVSILCDVASAAPVPDSK